MFTCNSNQGISLFFLLVEIANRVKHPPTHIFKASINSLQVNGEVFDLDRVLEGDCTLEFLKFEDDEGKLALL